MSLIPVSQRNDKEKRLSACHTTILGMKWLSRKVLSYFLSTAEEGRDGIEWFYLYLCAIEIHFKLLFQVRNGFSCQKRLAFISVRTGFSYV